jgi:hypothetical protein
MYSFVQQTDTDAVTGHVTVDWDAGVVRVYWPRQCWTLSWDCAITLARLLQTHVLAAPCIGAVPATAPLTTVTSAMWRTG